MKDVVIISASPRKGGNSETLAEEFGRGARDAGHHVEKVSLRGKDIGFCTGCLACQETRRCVLHDDADAVAQRMLEADIIVFATPIYYYEMCGQMKAMLDRTNPLYPAEYRFRDVYLLAAAAVSSERAMDGAVKGLQGWIECFDRTTLKGIVRACGVTEVGSVQGTAALAQAYAMGRAA